MISTNEKVSLPKRKAKVVGCKLLNLRREPDVSSEVIKTIPVDALVVIKTTVKDLPSDSTFVKVSYDKRVGYCMSKYLREIGKKKAVDVNDRSSVTNK